MYFRPEAIIRIMLIKRTLLITVIFLASISIEGYAIKKGVKSMMTITSPAFQNMETIPVRFSGEGEDLLPPLNFSNIPPSTKSLALIIDDPDAPMGTWVHFVLFNISPKIAGLKEGETPKGAIKGLNSANELKYHGPYPPPGKAHRYFFSLYALDITLNLKEGYKKPDVEGAMQGHILSKAELIGLYKR